MHDSAATFRDSTESAESTGVRPTFRSFLALSAALFLMSSTVIFVSAAEPAPAAPKMPFEPRQAADHQQSFARHLGVPAAVHNSLGDEFVLIPPGEFTLGPAGSTYRVKLDYAFYLATTETTLKSYRRFRADHRVAGSAEEFNSDDRPTAMVSWKDGLAYAEWLSQRPEELEAKRTYRLPSEAQWEWAARAGSTHDRHPSDGDATLAERAWFNVTYTQNPQHERDGRGRQPVARLKPNGWGLHDMFGNVWEWCGDRRLDPETGETREPVMRGGGWRSGGSHCNPFAHDPGSPELKNDHTGFRLMFRTPTVGAPVPASPTTSDAR